MRLPRESATVLRKRRGDDGLRRQDDDYRGLSTLHGVAGNTLALLRFDPTMPSRARARPFSRDMRSARTDSREFLEKDLVLAGAALVWRAGAHRDEKGHGLCHGTSGSGFALLKALAPTGDERWLERARRFAVHSLAQAERIATANGRRRSSRRPRHCPLRRRVPDGDTRFRIIDVM